MSPTDVDCMWRHNFDRSSSGNELEGFKAKLKEYVDLKLNRWTEKWVLDRICSVTETGFIYALLNYV